MSSATNTPRNAGPLGLGADLVGNVDEANAIEPKDAASLVIYDVVDGDVRLLMGQRIASQKFMPGVFVFPGGRMDDTDLDVARAIAPAPEVEIDLLTNRMRGAPGPERATALGVTAIRECFEEAGVVIGSALSSSSLTGLPDTTAPWPAYHAHGFAPDVGALTFFARAITPPGEVRRYDTRFFAVQRDAVQRESAEIDGELGNLGWYSFDALADMKVARITMAIANEFKSMLGSDQTLNRARGVPFYFYANGEFHRELITF